jgi:alpha-L-arabinofuranosidase
MIRTSATVTGVAAIFSLAVAGCTSLSEPGDTAAPLQQTSITVQVDRPGARINPAMWGAFFEDINFGGDGGLYAELVKNRGFEFPDAMMGWITIKPSLAKGDVTVRTDAPYRETQAHYVRIHSEARAPIGISNEGFRGMGVVAGETYDFSAELRNIDGNAKVSVELVAGDGTTLAAEKLTGLSGNWSKVTATLRPKATDGDARLALFVTGAGTVDADYVSLFPRKTWKNRPGGLRADMVQALADMHPGFLRFPGGCIVEGKDLAGRYQWKNTIGPVEDRKLLVDRWNYEFKWRPTPDYYQSFGLGFFEFFQLCEDIHAAPLPIVNCGMACQFNSGELCPPDALGPYIQDALDLIEFANGPATSAWGAKRAAMGHPEPFNPPLRMMGVGNEQWGPQYLERLALFTRAIKEKYPEVQLVSDAGPSPDDDRFAYLWPRLQQMKAEGRADIVDQHCYANPIWFLANADRFDGYDRKGPKIFFGEYAAQSDAICSTKNRNNLECALAEAAYMTGLERNAEVVRMASYAPLFANEDAWQWRPDLIWADSLHAAPSVNYYVQRLFCENRGDVVLPTTNTAPVRDLLPSGRVSVGTNACSAEFKDVRVTKGDNVLLDARFAGDTPGWSGTDTWKAADGVYRQTDPAASTTSSAGDLSWTDYTLTLKARRTSDSGAVVISVFDDNTHAQATRAQWILGGTVGGPTVADPTKPEFILQTHFAKQDSLVAHTPGTLETNRWYDVKVAVHGDHIECSLDGKLICSAEVLHRRVPALFTSAARDERTGQILLKVVNPGAARQVAAIRLNGADGLRSTGSATVLAGQLDDEDTLDHPTQVVPVTTTVSGVAPNFAYTFKPHSMTVLRLSTGH